MLRRLSLEPAFLLAWSLVGVTFSAGIIGTAILLTAPHAPHIHSQILPSFYTDAIRTVPWQEAFETAFYILACALAATGVFYRAMSNGYGIVAVEEQGSRAGYFAETLAAAVFLAVMILVITPRSFGDIATTLNGPHVGSYLFIPTLDFLAPHAVPGIDFESHYGIGVPWVFSFFLGKTFEISSRHGAIYICVTTVLFYAQIYALARYILGSALAAIIAAAFLLVSGFEGFSFSIPSDLPIRFLLCPLFLGVAIAISLKKDSRLYLIIGSLAAFATWWQTDTGLYCLVAATGFSLCLVLTRHLHWSALLYLLGSFAAVFILLLVATTGRVTLYELGRLLEPILLYSGGFGSVPMQWHKAWSLAYDLLTPALIGGSGAMALALLWRQDADSKSINALLVLSGFAFMAMMKWVNRSIDVVWWLNGWPIILIVALWWNIIQQNRAASPARRIVAGSRTVVICIGLLFIDANAEIAPGLSRSPAMRWGQYFANHPNFASDGYLSLVGIIRDPNSRRQPRAIAKTATSFLDSQTKEGERIAILSQADWQYLLDAHRPPAFYWLPVHLTHSWTLLDRNAINLESA